MKKIAILMYALYSLIYFSYPAQTNSTTNNSKLKSDKQTINKNKLESNIKTFKVPNKNGYTILNNLKDDGNERLWGVLNNYQFMVYKNIDKYIYVNGEFHQIKGKWENNNFYIPEEDALKYFNLQGKNGEYQSITNREPVFCQDITKEEVLKRLDNPNIPIDKAFITKEAPQMPGAERTYRNGKHEGFDWYSGAIGLVINQKTIVHPMFEGTIVRIDKDFTELTPKYRDDLLKQAMADKNTPQSTLDKLRGRQVWIQSKNGILVHYAHLSSVNKNLKVGDKVSINDWIGRVGNSGTSNGALGTDADLHLHTDILVCGKNFWEYGNIPEMNNSLIKIFDKANQNNSNQAKSN